MKAPTRAKILSFLHMSSLWVEFCEQARGSVSAFQKRIFVGKEKHFFMKLQRTDGINSMEFFFVFFFTLPRQYLYDMEACLIRLNEEHQVRYRVHICTAQHG